MNGTASLYQRELVQDHEADEDRDSDRTWAESEIKSMRANKWYQLINLADEEFFMGAHYGALIFAVKNDLTLTDNQRFFMLADTLSKFGALNKCTKDNLIESIKRKEYPSGFSVTLIRSRWPAIQKAIKEINEEGVAAWEQANKEAARQARIAKQVALAKERHSIYRFIRRLKSDDYGDKIIAADLYRRYLAASARAPDILSSIQFGRMLNINGLQSKQTKIGGTKYRTYTLNAETISAWCISFSA